MRARMSMKFGRAGYERRRDHKSIDGSWIVGLIFSLKS
jgi:hypothetical protein